MKGERDLSIPREYSSDPRASGPRELRMQAPEEYVRDSSEENIAKLPLLVRVTFFSAIAIFGIVVALGAIEIAFRLLPNSQSVKWKDRPQRYFIAENSTTLQDYHYADNKAAGAYRIAVVGDSFTFAPYMQFDDTFPKRLERWLNLNQKQPKVEVLNLGVPAYSTSHEVPVVRKITEKGVDLLLMQITLNDPEIKPYTPQQLYNERNRFGDYVPEGWIRHWKSLVFVLSRLHNNSTHTNYEKKFFNLFEKKSTWNNFKVSWEKIAAIAKEKKVPVVAVVFPLFGIKVDDNYPFWPIHKKIADLMATLEIPVLDLTETYRNIPLERLQVLPGEDFHPNEIAHRMAAEAIYSWFAEKKIVPAETIAKAGSDQRIGIQKLK